MFDLIQQNMGNGLGLQFMTEAILLILVFFGIKEAIRRNERRRLENKVSWFFEQRLKWKCNKQLRELTARERTFAKNWKKFQSSDVSPTGHRGWQFGWNKDYDLLARIKTVSGEMTMKITHTDNMILGDVSHGQEKLAEAVVKDFEKGDKLLAAHLATAQLIKCANEFIGGIEKPQPVTRWLDPKTPESFLVRLTKNDPLKETAPARFMGARDSFYIDDGKEAKEYLAQHQTTIMKSGYKIKDKCIFCPHPQYSPEAQQFKMKAYPKLTKAGIAAGYIKFSYPDREAVAEPCSSPRSEMMAMIQTHLHQQDLKSMKNVTDDNCVECPYQKGSTEAELFTEIVRGRALSYGVIFTFTYPSSVVPFEGKKGIAKKREDDRASMIAIIQSDLQNAGLMAMTEISPENCVACPYPKDTHLANKFEGIVCKRAKTWMIQPTFTYGDTDVPRILEAGEDGLTGEKTPPLDTSSLVEIPKEADQLPPVLRKFDVNDGWDWEQIPNKVEGRTCFQKEMHRHEYIIVIDVANVHESDADQDGNLLHVMATLLIAPENWTDFTELRRIWRSEETIEVDADITECENYVGTNLEDVAIKLNAALNFKLDGFYSALHCPFDDSTEEQRLAAHATVTKTLATGDFTTATDDETGGESE